MSAGPVGAMAFGDEGADPDACDAWVRWSALAEPGDEPAQFLVSVLGPQEALAWALDSDARSLPGTAGKGREGSASRDGEGEAAQGAASAHELEVLVRSRERWARRAEASDPGRLREQAAAVGARVIERDTPGWPSALGDLGRAAPFVLWVRGSANLDTGLTQGVAVVGARAATAYGEHVAAEIAAGIADSRRAVISGGAYGIDARAHRAALAADGTTIAFLAGGVDRLYPAGNADLLGDVIRAGAVVSEAPPGAAPHRSRFLLRNRLIATSAATVVVEAAVRSGALSTARHASAMARPVAAVPGPVTSASSAGCHRLVREQEAVLVTRADEVVELVAPLEEALELDLGLNAEGSDGSIDFAHAHDRAVFDATGGRGATLEAVAASAGLTLAQALASVGRLELAGALEMRGGLWRRESRSNAPRRR